MRCVVRTVPAGLDVCVLMDGDIISRRCIAPAQTTTPFRNSAASCNAYS